MNIEVIIFVVLVVLWGANCIGEYIGRYGGLLPWACVVILAHLAHVIHV